MRRLGALLLLSLAGHSLAAQHGVRVEAFPGIAALFVRSEVGPSVQTLKGIVPGAAGTIAWNRLSLDLGYWQGSLTADGSASDRDVVEGQALLGVHILPWLTARLGPHAWTYSSTSGTQRWFMWEGRLHADGLLLPDRLTSYFELWNAFTGDVNASQSFTSGMGGEGGLTWRPRGNSAPFSGHLGYSVQQVRLGGGARKETVQRLLVAVGFRLR